jgi:accessory colonization factor AcfC
MTIKHLIKAEKTEFDLVFDAEEERTDFISQNVLAIIEQISKGGFTDMVVIGNILLAHKKNPKAIEGIVKKVLTEK